MNYAAIIHNSCDNMCYPLDYDNIVISVTTGKDIKKVILHYGDPFSNGILGGEESWDGQTLEMTEVTELRHSYIWSAKIHLPYKRCRYFFEIHSEDEVCYFTEDGAKSPEIFEQADSNRPDFCFPWLNPSDVYMPPEWVNETIWYQIFPERFCNGDPAISPKYVKKKWGTSTTVISYKDFYGGDIKGITDKLDYLMELGITGLYLTPINSSCSNHKYNTRDYYEIDPNFGDVNAVKTFVREAHKRGMKVMFDGVFNHSGHDFAPWQDVIKNGPKSKYYDWFMINKWPFEYNKNNRGINAKKGNYYTFGFFDGMPKLNTNNPEVIDYFLDVCTYWVETFDIDAIRLDVANEVSHKFCKALRHRMDSLKEDFFILGEIWHNSIQWLRGDEFDSVMNYTFQTLINDFWAIESYTKKDFMYGVNQCFSIYPRQINSILFNLLDSHDTIRLITKLGNIDKFYQQLTVLFTMPGTVCIYYGTEIALEGGYDPDCRRCMPWDEIESHKFDDRIDKVKTLITARKAKAALRNQNYCFNDLIDDDRVISYTKESESECIQVILNCSTNDYTIDVKPDDIIFCNLYENLTLKANGTIVYKTERG